MSQALHGYSQADPPSIDNLKTSCVSCNSKNIVFYLTKYSLSMFRCSDCSVVFTNPVPELKAVSERYSQSWFENEYLPSYGIDAANPSLAHLASRYDRELGPVEKYRKLNTLLDIGAGAGLSLWQARERGWKVYGVELSQFGPTYAKKFLNIEIQQGTLESVQLESDFFDVVLLQDTLEHLSNPLETLIGINRILRKGGALVLSTPNFNSLGRLILQNDWALISPLEHLSLFNRKALSKLLKKADFNVDSFTTNETTDLGLIHDDKSAGLDKKRKRLKKLSSLCTPWLTKRLGLGDELFVVASKR